MRCLLRLRDSPHYRRSAFEQGLRRLGYTIVNDIGVIHPDDILICWNRYDDADNWGKRFKQSGARTLVAENCYFGNNWLGDDWLALSCEHHNGAGFWPRDDGQRWASFGVEIPPYQSPRDGCVLLLPQRSIGPKGVAMPRDWIAQVTKRRVPDVRIRHHPGKDEKVPLEEDLARCRCVVTWGSGAAIKALFLGVPCVSTWDKWIGATAATPIEKIRNWDVIPRPDRLPMFQRLANAIWRVKEIETGEAIARLLSCYSDQVSSLKPM